MPRTAQFKWFGPHEPLPCKTSRKPSDFRRVFVDFNGPDLEISAVRAGLVRHGSDGGDERFGEEIAGTSVVAEDDGVDGLHRHGIGQLGQPRRQPAAGLARAAVDVEIQVTAGLVETETDAGQAVGAVGVDDVDERRVRRIQSHVIGGPPEERAGRI